MSNTQKLPRLIFLDVDGPLISTSCYTLNINASIGRKMFNTNALGWVIALAKKTDARIVMNTSHNYHLTARGNVKEDLIHWGIEEKIFHPDWRTKYGADYDRDEDAQIVNSRIGAINDWMKRNGEHDWLCFDDANFTEDPRLIVVNFDDGITYSHYRKALKVWKYQEKMGGMFILP